MVGNLVLICCGLLLQYIIMVNIIIKFWKVYINHKKAYTVTHKQRLIIKFKRWFVVAVFQYALTTHIITILIKLYNLKI